MAVTVDASGVANGFLSPNSQTSPWDITTGNLALTIGSGSNRVLVVQLIFQNTVTSPAVIWDQGGTNQSMTAIISHASANGQFTCLFGLIAPTAGLKAVRVTWTGTAGQAMIQGVSWTGADQAAIATTFPNSTFTTGNNASPTITVTSAVGNACMSAVAAGSLQAINSTSATQTLLQHGAGTMEGGGSRAAGAATVNLTGSLAGTDQWVMVGTDILAVTVAVITDWFNTQRAEYPDRYRKTDLVPSGPMPGRGI